MSTNNTRVDPQVLTDIANEASEAMIDASRLTEQIAQIVAATKEQILPLADKRDAAHARFRAAEVRLGNVIRGDAESKTMTEFMERRPNGSPYQPALDRGTEEILRHIRPADGPWTAALKAIAGDKSGSADA